MDERLINYVKKNLEAGYHRDAVKQALIDAGYSIGEIEEHISLAAGNKIDKRLAEYIIKCLEAGYSIGRIKNALLSAGHGMMTIDRHIEHVLKNNRGVKKKPSQVNKSLIEYISKCLENGFSEDSIKQRLLSAGHEIGLIEKHIGHAMKKNKRRDNKGKAPIILALIALIIISAALYHFSGFGDKSGSQMIIEEMDTEEAMSLLNKALIEKNAKICEQIKDAAIKSTCASNFNPRTDGMLSCDENCSDAKKLNNALINNNQSICLQILNNQTRQNCDSNFQKNNPKGIQICDGICLDRNLMNLALISNNATVCLSINDSITKEQCDSLFNKVGGK